MEPNHVGGLVLATVLWIGLGACALIGGGSIRPGEFWTSTSSQKVPSHPTLVRAAYPAQIAATSAQRADARRASFAARGM